MLPLFIYLNILCSFIVSFLYENINVHVAYWFCVVNMFLSKKKQFIQQPFIIEYIISFLSLIQSQIICHQYHSLTIKKKYSTYLKTIASHIGIFLFGFHFSFRFVLFNKNKYRAARNVSINMRWISSCMHCTKFNIRQIFIIEIHSKASALLLMYQISLDYSHASWLQSHSFSSAAISSAESTKCAIYLFNLPASTPPITHWSASSRMLLTCAHFWQQSSVYSILFDTLLYRSFRSVPCMEFQIPN